jgi:hypothetical protein
MLADDGAVLSSAAAVLSMNRPQKTQRRDEEVCVMSVLEMLELNGLDGDSDNGRNKKKKL